MWTHLAIWEFVPVITLWAAWRLPDWVLKLLVAAEAILRFRRARARDRGDGPARPV
jgi:hypothetical protein